MSGAGPVAAAERSSHASRSVAHAVQAKLSVGRSNDRFEQEADRVSDVVVARNSAPAVSAAEGAAMPAAVATRVAPKISRLRQQSAQRQAEDEEPQAKVQRQEEEEPQAKLQRQEEEEPQAKLQRQEEEEPQAKLQRQEEEEPQAKLQRQEEEEPQAKLQRQEEEELQAKLQRQEEEEPQAKLQLQEEEEVQASLEPRANVRDKRMFPNLGKVEGKLFESKGRGEALDDETRIGMETSFGADLSGVRIHTGGDAVQMASDLKAQAFTHGNDIFFNSGKFEPDTTRGRALLAHELTHVVQQGAAEQKLSGQRVESNNAKRDDMPPEPVDRQALQVENETRARIEKGEPQPGEPADIAAAPEATIAEAATAKGAAAAGAAPPSAAHADGDAAESAAAEPPIEEAAESPAKEGSEAKKAKAAAAGAKAGGGKRKPAAKGKGKGGIGAFLRKATKSIFAAKKRGIGKLARAEKKKEPAAAKLAQTEKAVIPPAEESQSRAKATQVELVERAPEPQPDEAQAKQQFEAKLAAAVPATLEEVDEFKEQGKGRVVGEAVKEVVSADTQQVKGTYQEIENPPEPAPPETSPEELPVIEVPEETAAVNPGDGVVGEVQAEHTDMSEFEKESDAQLEKEQIKEEHLEMVDEGELAEANKERKSLKAKAKDGPAEVKQLEKQQKEAVGKELQKEEEQARQGMREQRQKGLGGAREEQQKTKSKLELERQKVTDHINGIYQRANEAVKKKLEDLETKSLKDFEAGEKQATKSFEDNVKRRIDAFKKRRYDRFGGSLLWAKDKLFGMDDLPEVKGIFDSEKSRFVAAVDALVAKITAENKRVIAESKEIVATAKAEIEKFVAGLGPALRQTGQVALQDMKTKLAALDEQINAKEKELQKKLQEKREAAIKAIEERIEAMKEEMSGLVSKLGNLLLNAMLKFFKWALKKAGLSADQLMAIINKGKAVISKIVTDPIGFIGNLVKAVKNGIGLFVTNIKKHLISGLISWLTGAMADVPITLPEKWDLKGIMHLVLQILGLTWARIRAKLVKRLGEKVVSVAETSVDIVKRLITEGPIALWEMIKAKAAEIKQKVMDGIRNWVIVQVVKQAVIKLISFLNPAGAIVQAVLAIYNVIMFFVENIQRIIAFVKGVFESVGDIAMGKLSAAAQVVERAMAMTIPIILGFLARLIGLSGIGKAVSKIITKIRKPIDKVVDKVVDKIAKFATKLMKKGKAGAKALKEKGLAAIQWWKKKKRFKNKGGETHTLLFQGKGKSARLMIASKKTSLDTYLDNVTGDQGVVKDARLKVKALKVITRASVKPADAKKITRDIDDLSSTLLRLAGTSEAAVSLPKKADWRFGGGIKKFAQVDKLSTSTTKGGSSPGSSSPNGWDKITANRMTESSRGQWVRMHMISQALGGKGNNANLVPAPSATNTGGQASSFESRSKDLVAKDNARTKKPNVIWIKTQVKRFHPPGTSGAVSYGKTGFAHHMLMQAGMYFAVRKNDKVSWTRDEKARISERIEIPLPNFANAGLVSINVHGEKFLQQATGASFEFARELIRQRVIAGTFPDGDIGAFEDRMRDHWDNELKRKRTAKFDANLAKVSHALTRSDVGW